MEYGFNFIVKNDGACNLARVNHKICICKQYNSFHSNFVNIQQILIKNASHILLIDAYSFISIDISKMCNIPLMLMHFSFKMQNTDHIQDNFRRSVSILSVCA